MTSQSQIYDKNNPRCSFLMVNFGFTKMPKTFGQQLKEKMDAAGLKPAQLSRLSGVTKQNIGRLINETPHPITGAPPTTTEETVRKIAAVKELNWKLEDALLAARIAPENLLVDDGDVERVELEAMYRKRKRLSAARKEAFKRILDMVDRELDRLLEEEQKTSQNKSHANGR